MTTLGHSSKAQDKNKDTIVSTIWTLIESDLGIICACLPMMRTPITLLFPYLFPSKGYSTTSPDLTRARAVNNHPQKFDDPNAGLVLSDFSSDGSAHKRASSGITRAREFSMEYKSKTPSFKGGNHASIETSDDIGPRRLSIPRGKFASRQMSNESLGPVTPAPTLSYSPPH